MQRLTNSFVGRNTLAAGIISIIQVATLFGFFGGSDFSAVISDLMVSLNAILVVPMFLAFGTIVGRENRSLGPIIKALGIAGALVKLTSSLLLISGVLPYEQTVMGESIGNILMGSAIVLTFLRKNDNSKLRKVYLWFSVLIGIVMISSLIGLIVGDEQFTQVLDGSTALSKANPLVVITLLVLAPISLLGWPVWLIGTGRLFLKEKLSVEDQNHEA